MPSPQPTQDDAPTKSNTPTSKPSTPKPATPKPSIPKPAATKTPPQRPAAAVKSTPNGTPIRQTGIKPRTPASAPSRNKAPLKKAEPTLLSDFLLGRPSPARQRRKSLDAVKAEMRESAVNRIRAPGGVHDRVKQWQKASAAAAIEESDDPEPEEDEIIVVVEEGSVTEEDRLRIKNQNIRPGRRKSRDVSDEAAKVRSVSAPRKRVISDDHWVVNKKKTPPKKREIKVTTRAIPKDFLKQTAVNPPLEKKIADWVKRTDAETHEQNGVGSISQTRETSQPEVITVEKGDMRRPKSLRDEIIVEIEATPRARRVSNKGSRDGRLTPKSEPSRTPANDGTRTKSYGENSTWSNKARPKSVEVKKHSNPFLDGISVKPMPVRKEEKQGPMRVQTPSEGLSPRKNSEKYLKPPREVEKNDKGSQSGGERSGEGLQTPTRSPTSRRQARKSHSPSQTVDEIPFGNSAFSALDLPLGAEAGTLNRPKAQRNPSLSMPNVFKRVYNEGKKMMHDTPEIPPRGGINQPPSIESWLNNTTDPFLESTSSISKTSEDPDRRNGNKEDSNTKHEEEHDSKQVLPERKGTGNRQKRVRKSSENHEGNHNDIRQNVKSPLLTREGRALEDPIELKKSVTPPPAGLRRSPATRAASPTVRSARKLPFKEALFDAFRGESTFEGILESDDDSEEREKQHRSKEPNSSSQDIPTRESPRPSTNRLEVPDRSGSRRKRRSANSGDHRLSTIASVETFSTSSSAADSSSNLTKTTLTQATTHTEPSDSNVSRKRSNKSGLKRRLTKHSDLVSMLSLPDTGPPGRTKSIRSARSVRTARTNLETATVRDLMRELADDEVKYMRELKTLVDGVIPVLLTCVLSKSDSAITAGLFNPESANVKETFLTKPIVDMGVALERLRNLHKRIPLEDSAALVNWLHRAHRTYQDYTRAWRLGFQDVIVNLAPVSRSSSINESSLLDSVPRNAEGDIVNANGERVDVAFLLKRPLVRIKYLTKLAKGLDKLNPSGVTENAVVVFTDLQEMARRRVKEECARLEDLYANNTDSTRARYPQTLAPVEEAHIDRNRQVSAKDFFALDFPHSNGQRIECRVEMILRDNPSDENDSGDVLICASEVTAETTDRYLLFPPITRDFISACPGEKPGQLVVMIRGIQGPVEWRESFYLEITEHEAATEWLEMLGSNPVPQPVLTSVPDNSDTISVISMDPSEITNAGDPDDIELPIGARRRRSSRKSSSKERSRSSTFTPPPRHAPPEVPLFSEEELKKPSSPRSQTRHRDESINEPAAVSPLRLVKAKHHTRTRSTPSSPLASQMMLGDEEETEERSRSITPGRTHRRPLTPSIELPYIPKLRKASQSSSMDSAPPKEEPRPDSPDDFIEPEEPYTPIRSPDYDEEEEEEESAPPPPPAHRSLSPSGLKNPIILEPPTPKVKSRRTSSPLKHEYQPSDESETSYSSSEETETETEDEISSSASSSDEDELESADLPEIARAASIYGRRVSPTISLYSLPNVTLAPSNSASQGPYRVPITHHKSEDTRKHVAMVTTWSNDKGRWEDIYPGPCSIVVSAGLIQVFEMSSADSNPAGLSTIEESVVGESDTKETDKRPLIAQVLTPVVTLRQSTSLDIEVHSPPTEDSRIKCSATIRYRSAHCPSCIDLYKSIHKARIDNPIYKKLEEERRVNAYGEAPSEATVAPSRRSGFFGRKKSYRASTRAPSVMNSEQSSSPSISRLSESFKRLTGSSFFNIAKSSIESANGMGRGSGSSLYTSSSGLTPPRTPNPGSLAGTSTYSGVNHTSENLKIRLYYLETRSQWRDCGNARLTVTTPPPGMRQACTVDQGIERRVLVTRKPLNPEDKNPVEVLLDVVLGANCFSMLGNKGVTCNVWEDVVGPNGEVGMVGAVGRVSGRTRKWCFQTGNVPEATWIYSLVAVGR